MTEDGVGTTCSMHKKNNKCMQNFGLEVSRQDATWKTQACAVTYLTGSWGIQNGGLNWIILAQDRLQWSHCVKQ
jgi:hypothetical protein